MLQDAILSKHSLFTKSSMNFLASLFHESQNSLIICLLWGSFDVKEAIILSLLSVVNKMVDNDVAKFHLFYKALDGIPS